MGPISQGLSSILRHQMTFNDPWMTSTQPCIQEVIAANSKMALYLSDTIIENDSKSETVNSLFGIVLIRKIKFA